MTAEMFYPEAGVSAGFMLVDGGRAVRQGRRRWKRIRRTMLPLTGHDAHARLSCTLRTVLPLNMLHVSELF